ncbi:sensor histidine kinase [Cohnella sp.]|uniref:cache domain-containing sensor histidine kinase n=1 Tax=Cohnella sp. TaxID=1883426 RepID=UPI0035663690
MKKRQWRIRPVLLLVFISFTGILLLVTCLLFYWNFSNNVVKQVVGNRLELIDQTHGQISSRLRDIEETALVIASNPNLIDAFGESGAGDAYDLFQTRRESVNNLVNPFLYSKPYLSSIRLFNDRFKHLPQSSLDRVFPYSAIEWDREALERSDSFWLGSHLDPVNQYQQKNVISYIRKIFNSNGRVVGLIEMNMEEQSLSDVLKGARKTYSGTMLLTDSGGRIVSRLSSYPEAESPERIAKLEWLEEIQRVQSDGYRVVDVGGTSYVVIYSYPNKTQWRLIEMIPAEQMYHPVKQIRNFVVLIALAGLLATIVIAYYLSGRMTRQVPELLGAFRRVQSGHFDASISESHSIFEYRQVAISFNRMVGELTASIESREKEQRAAREAEFRVLENQINPHFLYNTLDMINWMAAANGANEASLMSAKLAKLFRLSLNKGRSFITLAEEMEHGAIYSQIQQARFKESFVYEEEMDPAASRLLVPKLILQPFIENAIVHGFRGRSADRTFRIRVSALSNSGKELRIVIEDNGRGVDPIEVPGQAKSGGYGMANVNQRIQLHFGSAYGAKLENRPEGGARLEIRLPKLARIPNGKGGE